MTFSEITQLAVIFVVFTFIVHVYQSYMMKLNHKETMRVLEKIEEGSKETQRILDEMRKGAKESHDETIRTLEIIHNDTTRVLDRMDERAERRHIEILEKV
jgi:phosphoribosyl-ATP pyrophosphohydrolase